MCALFLRRKCHLFPLRKTGAIFHGENNSFSLSKNVNVHFACACKNEACVLGEEGGNVKKRSLLMEISESEAMTTIGGCQKKNLLKVERLEKNNPGQLEFFAQTTIGFVGKEAAHPGGQL